MFGFFITSIPANKSRPGGVSPLSDPPSGETAAAAADPDRLRDRQDIQLYLAGDSRGFEDLMNRYRHRAYGIAMGFTGNHDDAMDVVQKAFISVHRTLSRFHLDEPFFPWLYRIVRNAAFNQKRNEKRHRGDVPLEWVNEDDGRPDPLEQTVAGDLRERLWAGLEDLSPELREVFILYHFQGLKYRQIATAMQVPVGTVMSRLHTARMRLRAACGLKDEP